MIWVQRCPEEDVGSFGAGITGNFEQSDMGAGNLNLGALEKQYVF